jgi:GAF domain-containing protein
MMREDLDMSEIPVSLSPSGEGLQLFYRIAHTINGSLDLDATLQAILRAMKDTLGMKAVVIRLLNPDADALEVVAAIGISAGQLAGQPARITPGNIHRRVLDGETVHVVASDVALAAPAVNGAAELVAVPLQVRERTFGALHVYCATGCSFDDQAVTLLRAVADLAAVAIENARLHTSLFHIAQALTSSLELQPLLAQVLAATVLEMNLKAASVRLLDASGKRLELVAAHGLSERYLTKGPILVAKSPVDQRVLAGEAVVLYNVAEEPGFQYPAEAEAEGIRSVLAVPLKVKERTIGAMRVYSAQPRHFTPVGIAFLQSAAGLVAVAIENARLYQALQARYEGLKVDVSEWYRFLSLG